MKNTIHGQPGTIESAIEFLKDALERAEARRRTYEDRNEGTASDRCKAETDVSDIRQLIERAELLAKGREEAAE